MGRSRVTDEQLREAAATAQDLAALLRAVGLAPCGGDYAQYRARLRRLGVDDGRFQQAAWPDDPLPEALAAAAATSTSVAALCRSLGVPVQGRGRRRLVALLAEHRVDTSHFAGQAWRRGRSDLPSRARPLAALLRPGSTLSSAKLKQRLLREGVLEAVCSGCGGTRWRGRPMPLELDHVNGVRDDNRLENVRLLCPNCHALTDTYRGRNIGRRPSLAASPP